MKVLVFTPSSLCDPHFGMQLEEAENLYREGNEVVLTYCDGAFAHCFDNPGGDALLCKYCRWCSKKWIKDNLSAGIEVVPLQRQESIPKKKWDYTTVKDIKNMLWRDVCIGYGVMSSYTSATRNPEPDLSSEAAKNYFDSALDNAVALTERFYHLLDKVSPDVISIFNGRFMEQRALYDIAEKNNIALRVNESLGGIRTNTQLKRIVYYDHLPHSIPYNTELIHKVWEMPNEPQEEKEFKGREFFERRRDGIPAGDRVYIGQQKKGMLPENWDEGKRNIVIFNSSEDEFSAVGKDFEDYALFESQLEGINQILSHFSSSEYHFYLRIHPNLARVKFDYHTKLYELPEKYRNLTVIPAADPCSTYDLMDAAEKVIVFGSTMGAEAVFWGKPTILLAGAFYYLLDICYTPESVSEMNELIAADLPAKSVEGAVKYGYYVLNRDLLSLPVKYVDCTLYKLGKRNYASGYSVIWGSRRLAKLIRRILRGRARKRNRKKLDFSK